MATEFSLPELGENIESGDVVSVMVSVGDTIDVEDPVLEIETDKATIEVPSSVSGKITAIHVDTGDTVKTGQLILVTEGNGDGAAGDSDGQAQAAETPSQPEPAAAPAKSTEPAAASTSAGPSTMEFKLPDLGENIESGTVVSVLVSVGDKVEEEQGVLELETDKATLEVPSPVSGTVKEIHVKPGDDASVGQLVLTLETTTAKAPAKSADPAPAAAEPAEATPAEPVTVKFEIPDLGENIDSGTVVGVLVSVGDDVKEEQGVLELETDKATLEVPSTVSGTIKEVLISEGDTASVGQHVFTIETTGGKAPAKPAAAPESKPEPAAQPQEPAPAAAEQADSQPIYTPGQTAGLPVRSDKTAAAAAPNVRRIARELGVDIADVEGSGPGGYVLMADVKRHANMLLTSQQTAAPGATKARAAAPDLPDFSKWGEVERESMSNIRRATANQMETAWSNIPHVTQFDKADITELETLRKRLGPKVEEAGGKLTVTAILLKVVAGALKQFPKFNASIDMANEEIIYKNYYHIGVAVDTDRGLLVPVIRNVDQKNIIELAVELGEVAAKARDKKLSLDDMQGGTFTITNLGGIGGTNFTPIVNSPEVAILGVARGGIEPVHNGEGFEPRRTLPMSLSYDHRLIDGADGARFLRWIVQYLEDPFLAALRS